MKEQFGREYRGYSVKQVDKYIEMLTKNYEELMKAKEAAEAKSNEVATSSRSLSAEIENLNKVLYAERENQKKIKEEAEQAERVWKTTKNKLDAQIQDLSGRIKDMENQDNTVVSREMETANKDLQNRLRKADEEKERLEKRIEIMQKDINKFQEEIKEKSNGEEDDDAARLAGIFLAAKQQADAYRDEKKKDAEKLLDEAKEEKAVILETAKKMAAELMEEEKKKQQAEMDELRSNLEKAYAEKNDKLEILLHEAEEEVLAARTEADMIRKQAEIKMNLSNQKEVQCIERIKEAAKQYQDKLQEEKDVLYKRLLESADRLKEIYACAEVMSVSDKEHLEDILKQLKLDENA